jgi:hypothetical protein
VLAQGCAICLVLLVVSPVTAPFRTLDVLASCSPTRAAQSVRLDGDPLSVDDATLTYDPIVAKPVRFGGVIVQEARSGLSGATPLAVGSPLVGAPGATAGSSRVSPVLRL